MSDTIGTCDACRWWARLHILTDVNIGACHVNPPVPFPMCSGGPGRPLPIVAWAHTQHNDFCSKYEPVPE